VDVLDDEEVLTEREALESERGSAAGGLGEGVLDGEFLVGTRFAFPPKMRSSSKHVFW
jgi:hypothetical protein